MRFLRELASKITLEKAGILFFLVFFLFTPLIPKIKVAEGVFVEPLLSLLILSVFLLAWSFKREDGLVQKINLENLKTLWKKNKITFLFYSLVFVLFLSYFYGYTLTKEHSVGDFLRLIKYSIYFLAFPLAIYVGRRLDYQSVNKILAAFVLVGVIVSLVSVFRVYSFANSGGQIDFWVYSVETRSTGFLGRYIDLSDFSVGTIPKAAHATFGLYLAIVLSVCLALLSKAKEFSKSWLFLHASVGIIFVALLYTISRGAVATGGFVLVAFFIWLVKTRKFRTMLLLLLTLAAGIIAVVQFNPEVSRKFATTLDVSVNVTQEEINSTLPSHSAKSESPVGSSETQDSGKGVSGVKVSLDASSSERVQMWRTILDLLASSPLFALFGVGYSTDNLIFFTQGKVIYSHSLFLDMWVRGSLMALALMLLIWFYLFKESLSFVISKGHLTSVFGFTVTGFLVGWFGDNLISGEQFFSDAPMLAFWGIFGLFHALKERN